MMDYPIEVVMVIILFSICEYHYMFLCVGLALPYLLQPIFFPLPIEKSKKYSLAQRYSFKANVWIAIFSFIGNYWYTHYFYTVLQARYTFPAHRLNDVPIALYFATHFYFITYHTFANCLLRKIETRYVASLARSCLFWLTVLAFAYFTAFMETLTISSFPDYSFKDRYMAYTLGSAFYGIYFIVSFPVFYRIDNGVNEVDTKKKDDQDVVVKGGKGEAAPYTLYQAVFESLGAGMLVLILLDIVRLYLGIELRIAGKLYYIYHPVR